jgi:hypothetical protein
MPWSVRSVRFTGFLMPDAVVPANVFSDIAGEPENSVVQKAKGISADMGHFRDAAATFQTQPGRFDWLFAAPDDPTTAPSVLGEYPSSLQPFVDVLSKWASGDAFPAVKRVALGVVLVDPVNTRDEGLEKLRRFIDAVPTGPNADFLYQVNRYRVSRVIDSLNINRLAKWSVSQMQLFEVAIGPQVNASRVGQAITFANLDLDISTSAEHNDRLPHEKIPAIIDDMVAGVNEIATQGDRVRE